MSSVITAWNYCKTNDIAGLAEIVPSVIPANSAIPDEKCEIRYLLHAAAAFGAQNCFKYLIEKGADKNSTTPSGFTVLHWAAYGGWIEIMKDLFSRNFPMNQADKSGQTALHVAAARGHLQAVEFLIEHNALIDAQAGFKWTPLHFAVAYGHKNVVALLIRKGAKISQTDTLGRSVDVLAQEYKRTWWSSVAGGSD